MPWFFTLVICSFKLWSPLGFLLLLIKKNKIKISLMCSIWLYPRVTPALTIPHRNQSLITVPLFSPVSCTYSAQDPDNDANMYPPCSLPPTSRISKIRLVMVRWVFYWLIMALMPKIGHLHKVWILSIWKLPWIEILCPLDWPSIPNYFGYGCVWEKFNNNVSNETLIEVTSSCVFSQGAN